MTDVKLQLLMTIVFPLLPYAAEAWTVNKEEEKRLLAFEIRCFFYFGSEMARSKN